MQLTALVHETDDRALYPAPAGLGVGTTAHPDPFHASPSARAPAVVPTAMQCEASAQDTASSWPDGAVDRGVCTTVQAEPFQCSISGLGETSAVVGCRCTRISA